MTEKSKECVTYEALCRTVDQLKTAKYPEGESGIIAISPEFEEYLKEEDVEWTS